MLIFRRRHERLIAEMLDAFPAVLLVGARQTGKSFLARQIAASRPSAFFDLEKSSDLEMLANPGAELRSHPGKLIVIDEVQHLPELFKELRTIIDEERFAGRGNGKFLLLGSVSGRLQRQSESLAGRIAEVRLQPLDLLETRAAGGLQAILPQSAHHVTGIDPDEALLGLLWERGGYPQSILARDDRRSWQWRRNYLLEVIRKDAAAPRVPEEKFIALLRLIADKQGSIVTKQALAGQLQVKSRTVDNMLASLEEMMLIRSLPGYARNIKQQVRKAAKHYICDSGMHQCLVNRSLADLQGSDSARMRGASWEGFAIQNIVSALPDDWRCFYFEPAQGGGEVDLVLERPGGDVWAIEIKSGRNPEPEGLHRAAGKLHAERSFLVHGGASGYRRRGDIVTLPLADMLNEMLAHSGTGETAPPIGMSRAQSSPECRAAMAAVEQGHPNLNLRRAEFIADAIRRTVIACRAAAGPDDRQAGNAWVQVRNELLAWLRTESRRAPDDRQWQRRLQEAMEAIAQLPRPLQEDADSGCRDRFARLCCHDLLVHVTAVLLATDSHEFVGRLLARRWLVRGSMLAFVCFCAQDSGQPGQDARLDVPGFVDLHAGVSAAELMQAELLLLAAGMNLCARLLERNKDAARAAKGSFCWSPCLLGKDRAVPPLPFFRKTENPEGMQDFLACLGIAPTRANVVRLRQTVARFLDIRSNHLARAREDFIDFLNLANWHDFPDP